MRNKNIEREPRRQSSVAPKKPTALWKRPWIWIGGFIGALALMLTNLSSILSDATGLPAQFRESSDQFLEWYGEYDEWKGNWTSFPEGAVDLADMDLTSEPFHLTIDATKQGLFAGSVESRGICEKIPLFDTLLIDGEIRSASRADGEVFDFIGGHRKVFAKVALERDGGTMVIRPVHDPAGIFADGTRIARAPDDLSDPADYEPVCPLKRHQFIERAVELLSKPSPKLVSTK